MLGPSHGRGPEGRTLQPMRRKNHLEGGTFRVMPDGPLAQSGVVSAVRSQSFCSTVHRLVELSSLVLTLRVVLAIILCAARLPPSCAATRRAQVLSALSSGSHGTVITAVCDLFVSHGVRLDDSASETLIAVPRRTSRPAENHQVFNLWVASRPDRKHGRAMSRACRRFTAPLRTGRA